MAQVSRKATRRLIHARIRKKLSGTTERPRLAVHFSGQHVYAQIIDDEKGVTVVSASTRDKGSKLKGANQATATEIGKQLAEKAKAKAITTVVFDRGGFNFHGKVKALADAAREAGLKF
jgi:large subunit ribosomal protein L18